MKPAARRKARKLALQAIYSWQVSGKSGCRYRTTNAC